MWLAGAEPVYTPTELNLKLTITEFNVNVSSSDHDPSLADPTDQERLVERLLYLTTTRPNISFAVQCLNKIMHSPKNSHMDVAFRLVRYLKSTLGLGTLMSST